MGVAQSPFSIVTSFILRTTLHSFSISGYLWAHWGLAGRIWSHWAWPFHSTARILSAPNRLSQIFTSMDTKTSINPLLVFIFSQCCVSFRYTQSDSIIHYREIDKRDPFPDSFPLQVIKGIEYSSLCYTVGPCCLVILYIVSVNSKLLIYPSLPTLSPLVTISLFHVCKSVSGIISFSFMPKQYSKVHIYTTSLSIHL